MNRRRVLRQLGLGFSAGALLPAWLSSCKTDEPGPEIQYDGTVGIIGAGASGLLAADILQTKGVNVRIFEASDRIGGRIRHLRNFDVPSDSLLLNPNHPNVESLADFPVELGADRIYGSNSSWGDAVSFLKVPVVEFREQAMEFYFIDGLYKSAEEVSGDADLSHVLNFVDALANFTGDSSTTVSALANANGIPERVLAILNSYVGNRYGTSNSRLSAGALAEALNLIEHDNMEWITMSNPLQDVLVSRYFNATKKVEYNTPITSVNYGGDKVTLGVEGGDEIEVDKVIVTVPVSILKGGAIAFTPGLPSKKTSALQRIGMDASVRIFMEFRKNFWGESASYIRGGTVCPTWFNAGIGRSEFNRALSLTACGEKAEQLSAMGHDMISAVLGELDAVLDGQATDNIRRDDDGNMLYVIQDWSKEKYIKGAFSYSLPGGSNQDRIDLAEPVDDKLFIAGEATDTGGDYGTISGALNSAQRAADEVVQSIKGTGTPS